MATWTTSDIPLQSGRSAMITGAGGLGYEMALALARAGADVTLLGRTLDKGTRAIKSIRAAVPSANIRFELLDLASLASIQAFGARMTAERHSVDLLINNAGVMAPPERRVTADGYELQFGTNYLGHFALTAQLWPLLRRGNNPRVTHVSSISHRSGAIDFDNLRSEHRYKPMAAYAQSKLANLMFSLELQRRSAAAGWGVTSNAAHPGAARTELIANGSGPRSVQVFMSRLLGPLIFHSAANGALPILFAATSADAEPGGYYGPDGFMELKGSSKAAVIAPQARDLEAARRLWDVSVNLSHATYS
jgi:NAD(P)-dependent dehydrogenase (short-subunit alcohol dehydrogenase family)